MSALKQHAYSAAWPAMSDEEYVALVADIRENGQIESITLHEGKILDGWHRYRACSEIGIPPKTHAYRGKSALAFSISKNNRRNISQGQKALSIVKLHELAHRGKPAKSATVADLDAPVTIDELSKESGIGARTLERAKKVTEDGGADLNRAAAAGDISLAKAVEIADLPKAEQKEAVKEALNPQPKAKSSPEGKTVPLEKYQALKAELAEKNRQSNSHLPRRSDDRKPPAA